MVYPLNLESQVMWFSLCYQRGSLHLHFLRSVPFHLLVSMKFKFPSSIWPCALLFLAIYVFASIQCCAGLPIGLPVAPQPQIMQQMMLQQWMSQQLPQQFAQGAPPSAQPGTLPGQPLPLPPQVPPLGDESSGTSRGRGRARGRGRGRGGGRGRGRGRKGAVPLLEDEFAEDSDGGGEKVPWSEYEDSTVDLVKLVLAAKGRSNNMAGVHWEIIAENMPPVGGVKPSPLSCKNRWNNTIATVKAIADVSGAGGTGTKPWWEFSAQERTRYKFKYAMSRALYDRLSHLVGRRPSVTPAFVMDGSNGVAQAPTLDDNDDTMDFLLDEYREIPASAPLTRREQPQQQSNQLAPAEDELRAPPPPPPASTQPQQQQQQHIIQEEHHQSTLGRVHEQSVPPSNQHEEQPAQQQRQPAPTLDHQQPQRVKKGSDKAPNVRRSLDLLLAREQLGTWMFLLVAVGMLCMVP